MSKKISPVEVLHYTGPGGRDLADARRNGLRDSKAVARRHDFALAHNGHGATAFETVRPLRVSQRGLNALSLVRLTTVKQSGGK